ncbi:MAG: type II toxin-antitoxin system RelE/ParE family toxin [SAR324 cluster bacterium]|nr:type II toxin-antitoxin system RelE/ParE family toxin [SAR324 cluster bacterium]
MEEESYRQLQMSLIENPAIGNIIPSSGGIRKIRWTLPGQGKRGGTRVLYYWYTSQHQILMLYAYAKNKQENLTPQQLKKLRKVFEEE